MSLIFLLMWGLFLMMLVSEYAEATLLRKATERLGSSSDMKFT